MVKIGIVDHMPHANYAEESRIAYDEFFSNSQEMNRESFYIWDELQNKKKEINNGNLT